MKRSETLQLSELIRNYLGEEPDVHERLLEIKALDYLPRLLGDMSKYIAESNIKDGVMYIRCHSASVARGIMLAKVAYITRINEAINAALIRDIIIK